jgi:CBS domain-containing protein
MGSNVETASPSGRLDDALTRIHQNGCRVLMVVDNQKVVGLLTAANVGELIALEAAARPAAQTEGRADR